MRLSSNSDLAVSFPILSYTGKFLLLEDNWSFSFKKYEVKWGCPTSEQLGTARSWGHTSGAHLALTLQQPPLANYIAWASWLSPSPGCVHPVDCPVSQSSAPVQSLPTPLPPHKPCTALPSPPGHALHMGSPSLQHKKPVSPPQPHVQLPASHTTHPQHEQQLPCLLCPQVGHFSSLPIHAAGANGDRGSSGGWVRGCSLTLWELPVGHHLCKIYCRGKAPRLTVALPLCFRTLW